LSLAARLTAIEDSATNARNSFLGALVSSASGNLKFLPRDSTWWKQRTVTHSTHYIVMLNVHIVIWVFREIAQSG
jgi:hypothetical protein